MLSGRRVVAVTACLFLTELAVLDPPAAANEPACREINIPVTLNPGSSATYEVHGQLCHGGSRNKGVIQVLVAGATEGGLAYWDFPHPDYYESSGRYREFWKRYSYAKYLTDAGYASLTLDRIGTGDSNRPPADDVTIASNAFVVAQVVGKLRAGRAPFTRHYERVIGVGRSLSAVVLYVESVDHGGLDGLIIQSFRRHQTPAFPAFATTFVAAQVEPRLAGSPPAYFTTRAGSRGDVFFYRPNADPAVIEHEEQIKDTITEGEVRTFFPSFDYSERVSVPVLSVVGEYDALFCSGAGCPEADQEKQFFPQASSFESRVIPNAGHDMNLQLNNRTETFPLLRDWVDRHFGKTR